MAVGSSHHIASMGILPLPPSRGFNLNPPSSWKTRPDAACARSPGEEEPVQPALFLQRPPSPSSSSRGLCLPTSHSPPPPSPSPSPPHTALLPAPSRRKRENTGRRLVALEPYLEPCCAPHLVFPECYLYIAGVRHEFFGKIAGEKADILILRPISIIDYDDLFGSSVLGMEHGTRIHHAGVTRADESDTVTQDASMQPMHMLVMARGEGNGQVAASGGLGDLGHRGNTAERQSRPPTQYENARSFPNMPSAKPRHAEKLTPLPALDSSGQLLCPTCADLVPPFHVMSCHVLSCRVMHAIP
ncbi:hypothetical protein B7494_g5125 [Chlorociboria aeruginascens]|nr:hypothetical protein B7494_g5125 [Chlorociboria aeruginascens]